MLVDHLSASTSETSAAVMQDYDHTLVIGEPTFGKGMVQQYRLLSRIYN